MLRRYSLPGDSNANRIIIRRRTFQDAAGAALDASEAAAASYPGTPAQTGVEAHVKVHVRARRRGQIDAF